VGLFDCGREFGGSLKAHAPLFPRVDKFVAACAKADEIVLRILSESTPRVDVVHLKISQTSAPLAAPAIPLQYLLALFPVRLAIEPHPRSFWERAHLRDGPRAEGLPPLAFVAR
jgi:hypothetical protein